MRSACLNCGEELYARDVYCGCCGQKTSIKRISFKELGHEFFLTILHIENGLLRLFKGLLLKPGKTAAEFVEGKRKTYFNPFTFMAVCVAVTVIIHSFLDPNIDRAVFNQQTVTQNYGPDYERDLQIRERGDKLQKFSNNNSELLTILVSPWFAFGLWLFYRKRERNVAEITVAYMLFTAFSIIMSAIIISPWLHYLRGNITGYYTVFCIGILLQAMYTAWGLKGFFNLHSAVNYIKILAALGLIALIGFIPLTIIFMWYAFR